MNYQMEKVTITLELYLEKPGALSLREMKPLPVPTDNEVRIRVIYAGICGSDLRVYKGSISYAQYPIRPGHEVLGTVVAAGRDAGHLLGANVVVFPNTFCSECEFCLGNKTNICKDKKPLGVSVDGVFAQEFLLDAKYAVPVPAAMANERAVLIEPFAVTVHALKKADITAGTSVAVVGCGTEGLLAVALALNRGASVTVIDVNPVKLEIARRLGAANTLEPQQAASLSFDVVVEAAGVKSAIEQAVQLVKPGGVMIALGITGDPVSLVPIHIVRNEISIFGTIIYTIRDFEDAIGYLRDSAFHIEPVISKIVPYQNFQTAYEDALSGNYAKIVMDFTGQTV